MAIRLFSFEWRMTPPHTDDREYPKVDVWKTPMGATKAAAKWKQGMADEGCDIQTRVVELLPDLANHTRIPTPFGAVGEWA